MLKIFFLASVEDSLDLRFCVSHPLPTYQGVSQEGSQ